MQKEYNEILKKQCEIDEKRGHWTDVVDSIGQALVNEHYKGCDSYESFGPFGLNCEYSIHLKDSKLPSEYCFYKVNVFCSG